MKNLLMNAFILLPLGVDAAVIECPKIYPKSDVDLPGAVSGETASGRLQRSRLSHAYMYSGELHGEQTMVPPAANKVGGSWKAKYYFSPKEKNWLVCTYGGSAWGDGNVQWWRQLDPKIISCVLEVREIRRSHMPISWIATASCQ